MEEKNILAYFRTRDEAEHVSEKLKALRALDISIDQFSKYPGDGVDRISNPITGGFPSLGSLTLGADYTNKSAAIATAADVDASGMSDGGQDESADHNFLLTAIMDESVHRQALQLIKDNGGIV